MPSAFWSNTIWFVILGILTVIEMFFVLYKSQDRKHVLAVYFIMSGITFSIEATICCFLKAYKYYPMIIPKSPINDMLAGNLFSQFSVVATALLISVFNLKYYWFFIFSGIYAVIERLFLMLGVFSHNWYRTWITFTGFIMLFWGTKKIYNSSLIYNNRIWRYFFMFFGLYTLHMPTAWWIQMVIGFIRLNTKIVYNDMSSIAVISLLNLFILSISCMFIYFSKLKWWSKTVLTLFLYAVLYFEYIVKWIYVKHGLFLVFATIDVFGMYLYVFILDKLTARN